MLRTFIVAVVLVLVLASPALPDVSTAARVRTILASYGVTLLRMRDHGGGEYTLRVRLGNGP